MRRLLDKGRRLHVGMGVRLVRMDADRRPDVILSLGDANDVIPLALPRRDVEHRPHPGRARPGEHTLLILDEALIVQMAMTVGEHAVACRTASARRHPRMCAQWGPANAYAAAAALSALAPVAEKLPEADDDGRKDDADARRDRFGWSVRP